MLNFFSIDFGFFDVGTVSTVLAAGAPPADDATNFYLAAPADGGGNPQHYIIAKSQTIGQVFFQSSGVLLSNNFGAGGSSPSLGSIFNQTAVDLLSPTLQAAIEGGGGDDILNLPSVGGTVDGEGGNDSITGSATGDELRGDTNATQMGNDTLIGLDGNDTLIGEAGNDSLDGGAGSDSIEGGAGSDVIEGGGVAPGGFDSLFAGADDDQVTITGLGLAEGEQGNDTIRFVSSGNTFDGDFAVASYSRAPAAITANLTAATQGGVPGGDTTAGFFIDDGYGTRDNVLGIHVVNGSAFNDQFFADGSFINNFGNWIEFSPQGGDDTITATGITGTARVSYRDVNSAVSADLELGTATDRTPGDTVIGNDVFTGTNEFLGSLQDDIILGSNGDDKSIRGNEGNDSIDGRNGNNRLDGEGGNDTLIGGTGEDLINGGSGDDSIIAGGAVSGFDELNGGSGNDFIQVQGEGAAEGESGDDTIDAVTTGNDFVIAGYNGDPAGIIANFTAIARDGVVAGDTLNGFFVQDGFGDTDEINGAHAIRGGGFDDVFYVDDTYINSFGNNVSVRPGAGDDVVTFFNVATALVDYRSSGGPVAADLELGTATDVVPGAGDIGNDTWTGANQFRGSQGDDQILGALGDDARIRGHDGNDNIDGRSGNDNIRGENGNDMLTGGAGSDNVDGGNGNDSLLGGGTAPFEFDAINGGDGDDFLQITGNGFAAGNNGNDTLRAVTTGIQDNDYVTAGYFDSPTGIVANLTATLQGGVAGGNNTTGFLINDGFGTQDNILALNQLNGSAQNDVVFVDASYLNSRGNSLTVSPFEGDDTITFTNVAAAMVAYNQSGNALTADLESGTATDRNAGDMAIGSDTFSGNTNFAATDFDDLVLGLLGDDLFIGGNAGNDSIDGRSGNDQINGDAGDDTVTGGGGSDGVNGGEGNDSVFGGGTLLGEFDDVRGQGGNDFLQVTGNGFIVGGEGDDTIRGVATGIQDNDFATSGYNDDPGAIIANLTGSVNGGVAAGNGTTGFFIRDGFGDTDNVLGLRLIVGSAGNDQFFADQSYLVNGVGEISIEPNAGDDTVTFTNVEFGRVDYFNAANALIADLELGTATDRSAPDTGIGTDTFSGIDSFGATAFSDEILGSLSDDADIFGGDGDDSIDGRSGNDGIQGAEGNDTLNGGTGGDFITGGEGNDSIFGGGATNAEFDDLFGENGDDFIQLTGNGQARGQAGNDTIRGIDSGVPEDDFAILGFDLAPSGIIANLTSTLQGGVAAGSATTGFFVRDGYGSTDNVLGHDRINGSNSDDVIFVDDTYSTASFGSFQIAPDGGNDTITALNGALANIVYDNIGNAVFADLELGTAQDRFNGDAEVGTDSFSGAVFFVGSGFDDVILGKLTDDADIFGGEGNDSIDARDGNDFVSGWFGDDTILGGAGADNLNGNQDNDSILAGDGDDFVSGGDGNDTILGGAGIDDLRGDDGDDSIEGGGAPRPEGDFISGGAGNDFLLATGAGYIKGDDGDDTLRGESTGTPALDEFIVFSYDDAPLPIYANLTTTVQGGIAAGDPTTGYFVDDGFGTQDNVLGAQAIDGTPFNDVFVIDSSYTNFLGNWFEARPFGGDDDITFINVDVAQLTYFPFTTGLFADLEAGIARDRNPGDTAIGNDTFSGVNGLLGTQVDDEIHGQLGDDNYIDGLQGDDLINLRSGDDFAFGNDGNDVLIGGAGNDTLDGGEDVDTADYSAGPDSISANLGSEVAVAGSFGTDRLLNIENLIGSAEGDRVFGSTVDNLIEGRAGGDLLAGLNGNDTLIGEGGEDSLSGGNNDDSLEGGANDDRLFGNNGNDIINGGSGDDFTNGGNGDDTINGGEDDDNVLVGGADDDEINGGGGSDGINGSSGDDLLRGDDGADRLFGAAGEDTLEGGIGDDTLGGQGDDDTIEGGAGEDGINGGGGNDVLNGGADNDRFFGGTGNDTINGGTGDDTMSGQAGIDTFIFEANWGNDELANYGDVASDADRVNETIDLSALGISFADLTIESNGNFGTLVYITADGFEDNSIDILFRGTNQITEDDFFFGV
ncbi:MAG: calcium-binding protein [Pseudomonadota bacterium]